MATIRIYQTTLASSVGFLLLLFSAVFPFFISKRYSISICGCGFKDSLKTISLHCLVYVVVCTVRVWVRKACGASVSLYIVHTDSIAFVNILCFNIASNPGAMDVSSTAFRGVSSIPISIAIVGILRIHFFFASFWPFDRL